MWLYLVTYKEPIHTTHILPEALSVFSLKGSQQMNADIKMLRETAP